MHLEFPHTAPVALLVVYAQHGLAPRLVGCVSLMQGKADHVVFAVQEAGSVLVNPQGRGSVVRIRIPTGAVPYDDTRDHGGSERCSINSGRQEAARCQLVAMRSAQGSGR